MGQAIFWVPRELPERMPNEEHCDIKACCFAGSHTWNGEKRKLNMRRIIGLCLVVLLLLTACGRQPDPPVAENGVLDLSAWNFEQHGPLRLDGQWAFFFGQLLAPGDFKDLPAAPGGHIQLPGLWQGQIVNGISLPAKGYATYRLRVKNIPWTTRFSALYISDILSAGQVWINGDPATSGGGVGRSADREAPRNHTLISRFPSRGPDLDILLQVSNFHNVQGGVNTPIWLGPDTDIHAMVSRRWIVTAVLSSILMMIGLSHLVLFYIHKDSRVNLYFGLFCFLWAVQVLFGVNGGCLGEVLFPWLPWHWTINLSLFPNALTLPLMVMFYHGLFPHPLARGINRAFQFLGGIYLAYLIFSPPNAFDRVVLWYFFLTMGGIFYLLIRFFLDLLARRSGVRFLIPGYLFLGFTLSNDILNDLHVIETGDLIVYGSMGFILSYSVLISMRFSKAFTAVEDLSLKLKEQNRKLSKLNRFKDELLANTSHELKTPLNGIMGIAQSIRSEPLSPKAAKGLGLIEASGRRLLILINDLLDFSKLKKKDLPLSIVPVNLKPVVDSVLVLAGQMASKGAVVLENRVPEAFPLLLCDEDRLHQILINLIGNGIKFTNRGQVIVAARVQGEMAHVSVTDTGIGIDEKHLDMIFQSFEQVDQGAGRQYSGTGLGLTITRDLVALNGGQTGVRSRVGKGSVFWFTMPLCPGEQVVGRNAAPRPDAPDTVPVPDPFAGPAVFRENNSPGNSLVMAVDDDPINLQVLVNHLEASEMTVIPCTDGRRALDRLAQGPLPDLILLDVMMPGMTGYAVCHRIRQTYSHSELPVILLTAKHRTQDLVEGFSSGANDYLTKPFEKNELLARVKTQIHLKQSYHTLRENLALKAEIRAGKKKELELKLTQRKLGRMLDIVEDAVVAVNPGQEIGFCNRAFETLSGYCPADLLGKNFLTLFPPHDNPGLARLVETLDKSGISPGEAHHWSLRFKGAQRTLTVDITLSLLAVDAEEFWFMFFRNCLEKQENTASIDRSARFIANLDLNRDRLTRLESALQCLTSSAWEERADMNDGIKAIDRLLDELGGQNPPERESRNACIVAVMNLSVDYWTACTNSSRVELAEQSGLWNVYIGKDGWARTQTMDKYMSLSCLPSRPRWKNVVNTADYVLSACSETSPLREELSQALSRLRRML